MNRPGGDGPATARDDRHAFPNLVVVGAPKCATTSFYHYLAEHPDIVCPLRKESNFLLHGQLGDDYYATEADVRQAIAAAPPARYYADVAALYLYHDEAIRRARALCPDARFIVFVRHPVDLLHSLHSQAVKMGEETEENFEKAIAPGHWERQNRLDDHPAQVRYREAAALAAAVQPWLDAFGDQVRVIHFDDVAADAQAVYDGLIDWLGLPRHRLADQRVWNPDGRIRHRRLHRFMRQPPAFIARPLHALVSRRLRDRVGKRLERLNRRPHARREMSAATRAALEEDFAADIAFVDRFRRPTPDA